MAGLEFSSGIDKGFEKDLVRMNAQMNGFSKNVDTQGSKMDKTFKTISTTLGGIATVGAFVAAGKEIVDFSNKLETALVEVSTISTEVSANQDLYRDSLIAMSTQQDLASSSAEDLAKAYYDVVSAGYDGAEGLMVLEAAARAGTAGFVDTALAGDGITTVLNAWGKSASEAEAVSDLFFKTVEKGKTTFPKLGKNIAQVAPIAASMGVSFEEISGAVATVTKQGTPTAQAFTQIRASLISMNKVLGDGWADTMTYQEGLVAIEKQSGGSQNELVNMLGTVEAVNAVLALTGKNAIGAGEDLESMNGALGATAKAALLVTETTEHQIKALKANILAAFAPLGQEAGSAIADLVKSLNEAFESGNVEKYAKIILQLGKAFALYKISMIAVNQLQKISIAQNKLQALSGKKVAKGSLLMAKGNKAVAGSFKKMTTAFAANPWGLLVTALIMAIPLITKAVKSFESASSRINKINKEIESTFAKESAGLTVIGTKLSAANLSYEDKKKLINELNTEYGEYLPSLLTENSTQEEISTAIDAANIALKESIRLKILDIKATEQATKIYELQQDLAARNKKINAAVASDGDAVYIATLSLHADAVKKSLEKEQAIFDSIIDQMNEKVVDSIKKVNNATTTGIPPVETDAERKARLKKEAEAREKARQAALDALEISNQKILNALDVQYGYELNAQEDKNDALLRQELLYLTAKRKLVLDELEKLQIDQEIINARIALNTPLTKLDTSLQGVSSGKTASLNTDSRVTTTEDINTEFSGLSQILATVFDEVGEGIAKQMGELALEVVNVVDTMGDEGANKIQGLVGIIMAAGNIIKDVVTDAYGNEGAALEDINESINSRINAEMTLNALVRERAELELNSSAFLSPNYTDVYANAQKLMEDSQNAMTTSLEALQNGLVLTAEGAGSSIFGLNKTVESYGYTVDQILNGWDDAKAVKVGGTIANVLDPLDIFGGAASGDAMADAYKKVSKGFNSALSTMGKTSADMADFSSQEWSDFYTILDEGGYIVEENTKALVNTMKTAQEEYNAAMESMKEVISGIAGDLGDDLWDSIVDSIENGTDALETFKESLNDVFIEMAKAQVQSMIFQPLFDTLQEEMAASRDVGGDGDWQDDLLRFFEKVPEAVADSEAYLTTFNEDLQALGYEGISKIEDDADTTTNVSSAGSVSASITEATGSMIVGRAGAIMLSNERIANGIEDADTHAMQSLVYLKQIKINTDFLPEIAENTKKTYESLENI